MQTKATVVEVNEQYAVVETERTSACDGCHKAAEGGCSVCSLMSSDRKIRTKAENKIGAKLGDHVIIESSTPRMLWYALLIFILPLVLAVFFWCVVSVFTQNPLIQSFGAAVGFVGTFAGVWFYSGYLQKKRLDTKITEILD